MDRMAFMVESNILDLFNNPHITAAVMTHGKKKENIPKSMSLSVMSWNGFAMNSHRIISKD